MALTGNNCLCTRHDDMNIYHRYMYRKMIVKLYFLEGRGHFGDFRVNGVSLPHRKPPWMHPFVNKEIFCHLCPQS